MATARLSYSNVSAIEREQANLNYSVSNVNTRSTETGNWIIDESSIEDFDTRRTYQHYRNVVDYGNPRYTWTFSSGSGGSGASGTHFFTGLTLGSKNTVSASVSVSQNYATTVEWQEMEQTRISPAYPWGLEQLVRNLPSTIGPSGSRQVDSANTSLDIYTRPEEFAWSTPITPEIIIEDGLKADDWNKLVETAEKKQNYLNQKDGTSYSTDRAAAGDYITADIYNNLSTHCNCPERVTKDTTLILASHFTALADAINTY